MKIKLLLCALLGLSTVTACGGEEVSGPDAPDGDVSWYRDVLPVAQAHCLGCHNDEAPTFSMARFSEELAARAPLMKDFVARGVMPPWKPSSDCNSYEHENVLGEDEVALFAAWSDGGAVAGDPADAPPPLEQDAGLARIDRSMDMQSDYTPQVSGSDPNDLHCFVLDPALSQDALMVGFDIRPGERRVVHHVLLYMADAGEAEALDAADPEQGYACFGGPMAASAKVIAGWVPGMPANRYPTSTGIPLTAGSVVIMQVHYNTAQAGPLPDRTSVDLELADGPMPHQAQIMALRDASFSIPAHAEGYQSEAHIDVPAKGTLWAAAPHMHLLGRRALVEVNHADGSNSCVVDIPDWDFDWQQFYFLEQGIEVGPGDRVTLTCTWDNALDKTVVWGDGTEDEMCISYFYVTAGSP